MVCVLTQYREHHQFNGFFMLKNTAVGKARPSLTFNSTFHKETFWITCNKAQKKEKKKNEIKTDRASHNSSIFLTQAFALSIRNLIFNRL